ncbi:hypothetical protein LTS18_012523 [Coniosporium uncinatum]|uniref:Uncharacterized protein n=1 Tax=Coniosporium uncinatum TaxID=93489 RepID=A0ACC3DJG5_9PEZI|nr:hypothetical protein LTS18_012523 [Coniosporium uncinatum]
MDGQTEAVSSPATANNFAETSPGDGAGTKQSGQAAEARMDGLHVGRYYGRVQHDVKGSRSATVEAMLGGYYDAVRKGVAVALLGRLAVIAAVKS